MAEDDREALTEFLRGLAIVVVVIAMFLALAYFLSDGEQVPPSERFAVVDRYNGCDVVRYSPSNAATYKYFLDCSAR